ncbi:exonuclease SbcCD subunit D [Brachybacterium hainanense]|uniref:Nuclease SbcCD subunit D n=1 Tax=Brachybacterium hainanense TaxID=1541174 RepID=A0ABV6RGK7_9MICO
MRILHTSDWHLGRTLHGQDLHAFQERFHDFLVDLVRTEGVDVVVIPGDVYDRAVPSVDAVRLLDATLARLAELTTVVLTPGNHDSATRLGFGSALLRAGVHILADLPGIEHPVMVPDEHGDVLFFGLPYLEPDLARTQLAGEDGRALARSHEAVTAAALDRVRARIAAHQGSEQRPRSVVLAHTFVTGGEVSESERDLSVGGVDSVPASLLHGIDYAALGHLHGCQDLTARVRAALPAPGPRAASPGADPAADAGIQPTAWYSGSPLAFSFSERHHRKSVLLVDLGAPGDVAVRRIPTPVPRRLTELRGTLEDLLAGAGEHGDDWLKAIVTDRSRPAHLQERLREAYPHLLHTEYAPEGREEQAATPHVRAGTSPLQVMDEFFTYLTDAAPDPAEHAVLARAYEDVRTARQEAS